MTERCLCGRYPSCPLNDLCPSFEPVRDNCTCGDVGPFSGEPHHHMGFLTEEDE